MMYTDTVKYLFKLLLNRINYQRKPFILKPFYLLLTLCICIVIAIPITTALVKLAEVRFYEP